jgi:hypothetical protein
MDRGSGSRVLLDGRSFFDRFYFCFYRFSKSSENFSEGLCLVKTVLAFSLGRQVKVKFDLIVTICDSQSYLTAIAVLFAACRVRTRVLDVGDDVSSQIAFKV